MQLKVGDSLIELVQGDITSQEVDAIVTAANASLAGGGGVDGAIHRAAGAELMEETRRRYPDGCPTGHAVATTAGRLAAKFVFHAVGPVWEGGQRQEANLLAACHRCCLDLAVAHGCRTIAFPAISTGVYGYPMDLAAQVSLEAVRRFLGERGEPRAVRFVLWSEGALGAFARVLEGM